jgi:hypothetical protein
MHGAESVIGKRVHDGSRKSGARVNLKTQGMNCELRLVDFG